MTAKLDYRWHLRQVMAARGMFSTTDLLAPLSRRGITLSSSQVYPVVAARPRRAPPQEFVAGRDPPGLPVGEGRGPGACPGRAQETQGAGRGARRRRAAP